MKKHKYLTAKDVAARLNISRTQVSTLMQSIDYPLPYQRFGGVYRFREEDIERYEELTYSGNN